MLTDLSVKRAKPRTAPYKLSDRDGLYLLVTPSGGRWWRYDYRHAGKRKTISLGVYDDVTLAGARERLRDARALVADGRDPSAVRKATDSTAAHCGAQYVCGGRA